MRKLALASLLGLSIFGASGLANAAITDDAKEFLRPNTLAAQGCMKVRDYTDNIIRITSIDVLTDHYGDDWLVPDLAQELIALIDRINAVGIELFLADDFYFLRDVRGVYYTDTNGMFMNESPGHKAETFLTVLRHEAWHAVQDCMAGTLDNSMVAIVLDPRTIPDHVKLLTDIRYKFFAPQAIPWEQEAILAGDVPDMSADALNACASGEMWTEYTPTPKTEEWLKKNGFMK